MWIQSHCCGLLPSLGSHQPNTWTAYDHSAAFSVSAPGTALLLPVVGSGRYWWCGTTSSYGGLNGIFILDIPIIIIFLHVFTTSSTETVHPAQKFVVSWHEDPNGTTAAYKRPLVLKLLCCLLLLLLLNYYLTFIPCISVMCSLYMSRAVCRFVVLSPALKTESRTVFFTELGFDVFINCMINLKLPRPLSPPSLIHNSSWGMAPPWSVRPAGDLGMCSIN